MTNESLAKDTLSQAVAALGAVEVAPGRYARYENSIRAVRAAREKAKLAKAIAREEEP